MQTRLGTLIRPFAVACAVAVATAVLLTLVVTPAAAASAIVVDSSADTNSRDGVVTLREALLLATGVLSTGTLDGGEANNVSGAPGAGSADVITFDASVFPSGTPATITIGSALPNMSTGNDTVSGSGAGVVVDGTNRTFNCFTITGESSDANAINGIQIRRCLIGVSITGGSDDNVIGGMTTAARNTIRQNATGVEIDGAATTGNQVKGNVIGLDVTGATAQGNTGDGVVIDGAPGNTIGGTASYVFDDCSGACNVISANGSAGVVLNGVGATGNYVMGNFVGTDLGGTLDRGNTGHGVEVVDGSANQIGDTAFAGRNVISANGGSGVEITGSTATGNVVLGNYIGTTYTGGDDLGNTVHGIRILSPGNTVGGTTGTTPGGNCTGACNIISSNVQYGITINSAADGNEVLGNYIGTDMTGTFRRGNIHSGLRILDSSDTCVGGLIVSSVCTPQAGGGNVISANGQSITQNCLGGITIEGATSSNNVVIGNLVGTKADGTGNLGNCGAGIQMITQAHDNIIGGTTAAERNVVSGSQTTGISVGGNANRVSGNYVGTNASGTSEIDNAIGISLTGTGSHVVGGTTGATPGACTGACNLVSASQTYNVAITSDGNLVQGNFIGTNLSGNNALQYDPLFKTAYGIDLRTGASNNCIGGTFVGPACMPLVGAGNVVSGATRGVHLFGASTSGNYFFGNRIGTNAAGTASVANGTGMLIEGSPNNVIGGSEAGAGNLISANTNVGIEMTSSNLSCTSPSGNVFHGNLIGLATDGVSPLGNLGSGIFIDATCGTNNNSTVGGVAPGEGNKIAHNTTDGVKIDTGTGHRIRGNSIYSNGQEGIDLNNDGPTANDAGDADGGPNSRQNYPLATSAVISNVNFTVMGTLNSTASSTFTLDFYSSPGPTCDAPTAGEGKVYLGSTSATTDVSGNASFSAVLSGSVTGGDQLTGTATNAANSTSEFSGCRTIVDCSGTDTDGDGLGTCDNCPTVPNPDQLNQDGDLNGDACEAPGCELLVDYWPIPVGDPDCDGFTTTVESFLGTDPLLPLGHCAVTGGSNNEPLPDRWPADFDDNQMATTLDLVVYNTALNTGTGNPNYVQRADLNANGSITTLDLVAYVYMLNKKCV